MIAKLLSIIGIAPADLATVMASVTSVLVLAFCWSMFVDIDRRMKRTRKIEAHAGGLRQEFTGKRKRGSLRRIETQTIARKIVDRFNLMKSHHAEKVAGKLMQSGIRSKDAVVYYLALRTVLPLALGGLVAVPVFLGVFGDMSVAVKALIALLGAFLGSYLPDIFIKNRITKRRQQINLGLPDALDLLVICAEAGLGLEAALTRVAEEMHEAYPELAEELALLSVELGLLPDRRRALENLTARVDLPQIRSVVNTLQQSERYGTPLANALRILADEYRNERMMRAEEKAARLPATLTVPMIIFILPTLFIVLIGPAAMKAIDALSSMN